MILGYRKDGTPIEEIKRGMVTTRALVVCHTCDKTIRSHGGPIYEAICIECHWRGYKFNEN